MEIRTTVTTSATGYYHIFVIPYITSFHYHNPDCRFEIFVDDCEWFEQEYSGGLSALRKKIGNDNLLINNVCLSQLNGMPYNQAVPRFLQKPNTRTPYFYLGDIDILVLETHISERHIFFMEKNDLPFSNVLRSPAEENPDEKRLSGLHFSEWEAFFPQPQLSPEVYDSWSSEFTLFEIVKAKIGDFEINHNFRPIHGFHLSDKLYMFHEDSTNQIGLTNTAHVNSYLSLRSSETWGQMKNHFSPVFLSWLDILDGVVGALWPDLGEGQTVPEEVSVYQGRYSGPGMEDLASIPGISSVRHQFLDTKFHIEANTGAGEIFGFLDFCEEEGISNITDMSSLEPTWLLSINRCFDSISRISTSEKMDEFPLSQHKIGTMLLSGENEGEIDKTDLLILGPDENNLFSEPHQLSSLINKLVSSLESKFVGIISSNSFDKRILKSDLGLLVNVAPFFRVDPLESFCINRRYSGQGEHTSQRFDTNEFNSEISLFIHIFSREELLNNPLSSNSETPFPSDFLSLRDSEKWEKMLEIITKFPYTLSSIRRLPQTARMYYMLQMYEECAAFTSEEIEEKGPTHPDMWLFNARSNVATGNMDTVLENYSQYLARINHIEVLIEAITNLHGIIDGHSLSALVSDFSQTHGDSDVRLNEARDILK